MTKQEILNKISELLDQYGVEKEYFKSLSDNEVPQKLQPTIKKWRKLAKKLNYSGNIAYKVKAGFTLKGHAPLLGNCYEDFKYLQNWKFNDEPTENSLVFFIPVLIGLDKTKDEQLKELKNYKLNIKSFGEASLLAGLILIHYNLTGIKIPVDYKYIRTDTLRSDGVRLGLGGFDADGLYCGRLCWDGDRPPGVGCFPLGVEIGSLD